MQETGRRCCDCGEYNIFESMGSVNAGDFADACEGKIPRWAVRERCGKCVMRRMLERERAYRWLGQEI